MILPTQFVNSENKLIDSMVKSYNFSEDQEKVFRDVISNKHNCLITGSAGSGKSYVLKALKEYFGARMALTSTTGISSLNVGGQTLHSFLKIFNVDRWSLQKVLNNIKDKAGKNVKGIDILVIEECSMCDSFLFSLVDYALRNIMDKNIPFGGKQILLVGDFMQLPPVECLSMLFESESFLNGNFQTHYLTNNHRQDNKSEFYKILQECRYNKISNESFKILKAREELTPPENILHLYCTNNENDKWNNKMFDKLPGEAKIYESDDWSTNSNTAKLIEKGCLADQELKLKIGARVILLKNLDIKNGLVNGSTGEIIKFLDKSVLVEFDNGITKEILPARWEWYNKDDIIAFREQLPLKLAYSITIHKSQGMSLDKAFIDLSKTFADGQAYVALSRLRSIDGLYLKGLNRYSFKTNAKAKYFYESTVQ